MRKEAFAGLLLTEQGGEESKGSESGGGGGGGGWSGVQGFRTCLEPRQRSVTDLSTDRMARRTAVVWDFSAGKTGPSSPCCSLLPPFRCRLGPLNLPRILAPSPIATPLTSLHVPPRPFLPGT